MNAPANLKPRANCPALLLAVIFAVLLLGNGLAAESANKPAPAKWETLKNVRFEAEDYNDGDSFHVRYQGREFIFRLYFVDAPETDDSFPDRNREQARHFGVTAKENRRAAEAAKALTAELLKRPFTVTTRWQNAMGRSRLPRYYAVVRVGGEDLGEVLLKRGLARAKGAWANLPDGERAKARLERLKQLEAETKAKRVGVWAHSKKTGE
ncbi:MAG: thermonuclease family protein [Verrucomicrobia bacterium]|nr:thermonuclease family protein [Verrucomicrobiota bacterium]